MAAAIRQLNDGEEISLRQKKKNKESSVWAETFYFVPDEFAYSGGLWPVRMGRNTAVADYKVGPKTIECYNLHFVINGTLNFQYEGVHAILAKGDIFCMYPEAPYRYEIVPGDAPLQICWISFDGAQAQKLLEMAGFTPASPYLNKAIHNETELTLRQLYSQRADEAACPLGVYSCLYQLFEQIISRRQPVAMPASTERLIHTSIEYMKTHFMDNITVQDAADYISLHRVYFSKLFTEHTGITPSQYLQKLKMDKAVQLLTGSAHSITEISLSLGYSDVYAFTRAFAKFHGCPPGSLRKKHQSGRLSD